MKDLGKTEREQTWIGINCFLIMKNLDEKRLTPWDQLYHHHHYQVKRWAQIPQTLSCHPSLMAITLGRSCRLQPVSAQSWFMYVFAGQLTFVCLFAGIHGKTSLITASPLLYWCIACLLWFILLVCEMGVKWLYSCCFVWCYF